MDYNMYIYLIIMNSISIAMPPREKLRKQLWKFVGNMRRSQRPFCYQRCHKTEILYVNIPSTRWYSTKCEQFAKYNINNIQILYIYTIK